MKLLKWFLVLVGFFTFNNSFAMENDLNHDLVKKLEDVNGLIQAAEDIIESVNTFYSKEILKKPVECMVQVPENQKIAMDCVDRASKLMQLILSDPAVTNQIKGNVNSSLQRINSLKDKAS